MRRNLSNEVPGQEAGLAGIVRSGRCRAVRFDRLEQLQAGWQTRLEKLDFDALDQAGRVDWLLLENEIHRSLAQLARDRKRLAEMVDFLVNRVGHEQLGATSEVRRFIADGSAPLYQAGYLLGGLQLEALHDTLAGPGKMTEQQFHDAVLAEGPIPIALLRASLLKQPLARDMKPDWKFAGDQPASAQKLEAYCGTDRFINPGGPPFSICRSEF